MLATTLATSPGIFYFYEIFINPCSLSIGQGRGLFLTGSFDGSCCLFDPRSPSGCISKFVKQGDPTEINCISFSMSEDYFVAGGSDSHTRLYDVRWNESHVSAIRSVEGREEVGNVALSLSSRYLFCSGDYSQIYVWDLVANARVAVLSSHNNRVSFLELSPNGYGMLSGSWDSYLRLWTKY